MAATMNSGKAWTTPLVDQLFRQINCTASMIVAAIAPAPAACEEDRVGECLTARW